ncbi:hypothetical protein Taro_034943 [Colocasia esculenta]|uniref:LOB domain-containing protein n=1 Tax=Colocasia esculenta TaxID=4460 RepID=A0A843WH25_COLES|nr:hypothetical protein [Colocasia esculenta]
MSTGSTVSGAAAGSTSGGGGGVGAVGGTGGGGGGGSGPCGACKFLRRKCVSGCIFAPYFDSEQGATHFAAVHKVFGASNVSKLLLHIPAHKRLDAVVTVCYEAQARLRDPVYGCVAHIIALQRQVVNLQAEISYLRSQLGTLEARSPPPPHHPPSPSPPHLSISDLPSPPGPPALFDLSRLFDSPPAQPPPWLPQQQEQQMVLRHLCTAGGTKTSPSSGAGDLQAMTREFADRRRPTSAEAPPSASKVASGGSYCS